MSTFLILHVNCRGHVSPTQHRCGTRASFSDCGRNWRAWYTGSCHAIAGDALMICHIHSGGLLWPHAAARRVWTTVTTAVCGVLDAFTTFVKDHVHLETGKATAQRVKSSPAALGALNLCSHTLVAHAAFEVPPLTLDRIDAVNRLHLRLARHVHLGNPLHASYVRPAASERRWFQRATCHGAEAALNTIRPISIPIVVVN